MVFCVYKRRKHKEFLCRKFGLVERIGFLSMARDLSSSLAFFPLVLKCPMLREGMPLRDV
jgi:hypothetical protein